MSLFFSRKILFSDKVSESVATPPNETPTWYTLLSYLTEIRRAKTDFKPGPIKHERNRFQRMLGIKYCHVLLFNFTSLRQIRVRMKRIKIIGLDD